MKRVILFFILLLGAHVCHAQLEWDTKEYIAFDENNGYAWNLPWDSNHVWVKQQGLEAHTVFRVYQPQTGIVAFLNFTPFTKEPKFDSILDIYDKMEEIHAYTDRKLTSMGVTVTEREDSPSMLNKVPAIREYYIQKESKGGKVVRTHCLKYSLMGDLGTYIVATKCFDTAFKKYGIAYLEGILKGFILISEDE